MAIIDLTVKVWFHECMRKNSPGQVGLMLLVVMGVVISLVLSIASRSLTDTVLSRQEKENVETFAIAESGVEQALLELSEQSGVTSGNLADSAGLVTGNFEILETASYDLYVKEGEVAQIDLSGSPSNVVVRWIRQGETPGTCAEGSGNAPAALEIVLINSSNVATRYYYNANGCNLSGSNYFANASAGSNGYASSQTIAVVAAHEVMRIKPLYNGATINVTGNNLASQLYLIQATAEGGDAQTDIEVKRSLDTAGSIFDYALFSDTTIIK